jgi:hypothetical protein
MSRIKLGTEADKVFHQHNVKARILIGSGKAGTKPILYPTEPDMDSGHETLGDPRGAKANSGKY